MLHPAPHFDDGRLKDRIPLLLCPDPRGGRHLGRVPTASAGLTVAVTTLHFLGGAYELRGKTSLRERYTGMDRDGFIVSTRGQAIGNVIADLIILAAFVVGLVVVAGDRYLALTAALLALSGNIFCYYGRN